MKFDNENGKFRDPFRAVRKEILFSTFYIDLDEKWLVHLRRRRKGDQALDRQTRYRVERFSGHSFGPTRPFLRICIRDPDRPVLAADSCLDGLDVGVPRHITLQ